MDPDTAWVQISQAIADAEWDTAAELADGLLHWLTRDGFPPRITGIKAFDKLVARATCEAIAAWEIEPA